MDINSGESGANHVSLQSRANCLVILDGNAILHRAYHAMPPLSAPDGSLVNAVYGFASILFKIVTDFRPTHLAVAFDRPAPTFRKELYKEYQASRPKMEDALVSQIGKIHDLVEAFGISIFEKDGYEADDLIGTVVAKSQIPNPKSQQGGIEEIIIVTGDRDILQLVIDDLVYVYMPVKGLSEGKLYQSKDVMERLGVLPEQIADYKALAGDNSDNYPGVAGIGPKTASMLVTRYGSVEALYKAIHAGDTEGVSAGILAKLQAAEETALFFKTIATIKKDVPAQVDLDALQLVTLDTPAAREQLTRHGFSSLLKRLDKNTAAEKPKKEKKKQEEEVEENEQLSLV